MAKRQSLKKSKFTDKIQRVSGWKTDSESSEAEETKLTSKSIEISHTNYVKKLSNYRPCNCDSKFGHLPYGSSNEMKPYQLRLARLLKSIYSLPTSDSTIRTYNKISKQSFYKSKINERRIIFQIK